MFFKKIRSVAVGPRSFSSSETQEDVCCHFFWSQIVDVYCRQQSTAPENTAFEFNYIFSLGDTDQVLTNVCFLLTNVCFSCPRTTEPLL
uniref:Uncharacterized protein n=1 Tax=Anguilla anguilla TaxID=7936 RepID=A0A0E9WRK1_ANGAN